MATTRDPTATGAAGPGCQVVAMFETFERARGARDQLAKDGIPTSEMDIVNRDAEPGHANFDYERTDEGFWSVLRNLFIPGDHAGGYVEGLRRGHAMLVVRPSLAEHARVEATLESYDPIDFDAQEEAWRGTGWTGGPPPSPRTDENTRIAQPMMDRGAVRVRSYTIEK